MTQSRETGNSKFERMGEGEEAERRQNGEIGEYASEHFECSNVIMTRMENGENFKRANFSPFVVNFRIADSDHPLMDRLWGIL